MKFSLIGFIVVSLLIFGLVFIGPKRHYWLFLSIIALNAFTEISINWMASQEMNFYPVYNSYYVLHQTLWLLAIVYILRQKMWEFVLVVLFLVYGCFDFVQAGPDTSLKYTWIIGSMVYIIYFLVKHVRLLSREQMFYFGSRRFALLSSALFMMFGQSFIAAFSGTAVMDSRFGDYSFYTIINHSSNYLYYGFLAYYLYKMIPQSYLYKKLNK